MFSIDFVSHFLMITVVLFNSIGKITEFRQKMGNTIEFVCHLLMITIVLFNFTRQIPSLGRKNKSIKLNKLFDA